MSNQSTLIAGPTGIGGNVPIGGGGPWNVGLEFTCAVSGNSLYQVGFFKNSTDTGTHIANVWQVSGSTLLAQQTFTAETASGWQWLTLTTPIALTAGAAYRACVTHPTNFPGGSNTGTRIAGPYTVTDGNFGNNSTANSGVNYPSTSFPTWYFGTDVVVDGFPGNAKASPFWYPGPLSGTLSGPGGGPFIVAQDVTVSAAGLSIDQVLYYKVSSSDAVTGSRQWAIYRTDTQAQVASGTFGTETASGWLAATLATPLALTNGLTYRVAVQAGASHLVASSFSGATLPGLSAASTGTSATGSTMVYPTTTAASTAYGVDVWVDGLPSTTGLRASQVLAETWIQNAPPTTLRASQVLGEVWTTDIVALRASQVLAEVWVIPVRPPSYRRLQVSAQVI